MMTVGAEEVGRLLRVYVDLLLATPDSTPELEQKMRYLEARVRWVWPEWVRRGALVIDEGYRDVDISCLLTAINITSV